jgi:hypothetical protein
MPAIELDGFTRNRILIDSLISEGQSRRQELLRLVEKVAHVQKFGFRQRQIIPELVAHASSSFDLLAFGWKQDELFHMGAAARSLYETRLFTGFVIQSETNAVRFYQDGMADIRDIFNSLGKLATDLESAGFQLLVDQLRNELAVLMTANDVPADIKYLRADKVAKSVALGEEHNLHYQFLSKFSHASSVTVLTRGGQTWKQFIAPVLAFIGVMQYLHTFGSVIDAMAEADRDGPIE